MEQSYHMFYIHSRFGCYYALGFYRQLYSQSGLPDELREGIPDMYMYNELTAETPGHG